MPLYEFSCRKCRHEFEELVTFRGGVSDAACPKGFRVVSINRAAFNCEFSARMGSR